MPSRLVSIVVVTIVEAPAIYLWLRLHEAGHRGWGLVVLVLGEMLETALALRLITRQGDKVPEPPEKGAARMHLRRVQAKVAGGAAAEIGIWVLWLALAEGVAQVIAAGVLLVLMHLKHHVELVAVRDTPLSRGLFSPTLTFASAMEAAGAVACLAFLHDGQPALAAIALGVGFSVEHTILVGKLHREMETRDVRRPRDVHA